MDGRLTGAPSPRLWTARQLQLAAVAAPVLLVATISVWLVAGTTAGTAVLLGLLAASAVTWRGLHGRYTSWRYEERAEELFVSRGYLFHRQVVVPYGRMQFIDVTAGPVDRWFGLATVQLHTAAAASDARIPGLPRAEAERLRDQLARLGESRAAGL